jgi:hypothetical protein
VSKSSGGNKGYVDAVRGNEETHRMATAQRLDVEEGEDLVALEELKAGDFTCGLMVISRLLS